MAARAAGRRNVKSVSAAAYAHERTKDYLTEAEVGALLDALKNLYAK